MDDKTFTERLELEVEGSWWKRIDDDAVGTILKIRDDNSNNLVVGWTHPSFEGARSGEYDRYEFVRKWVPLSVPVKVDSIWKSNKTGDMVKVLIEPDASYPSVDYINLNDTTGDKKMSHVDKAVFITEHTFLRDNDNGALYRHNKNPNTYLKVIETTKKPTVMGALDYVKYRVIKGDSVEDGHVCLIVAFHSCCHLLSLDPEKEYTVPIDSVRTIKAEDEETKRLKSKYHKIAKELRDLAKECEITVGSIWRGVKGIEEYNKGRLIKVVHINGSLISWRYLANAEGCPDIELNRYGTKTTCDSSFLYCFEKVQDNDDGAIYQPFDRVHDARENPGKYQMVKVVETNVSTTTEDSAYGTIKYITTPISSSVYSVTLEEFHSEFELVSLNPAEEFCVDINDPNHSRKLIDPNEGESKMKDNETYLKTDKEKLEDFGTGAKREDKSGKGRYDLIPGDVMRDFEDYVEKAFTKCEGVIKSPTEVDVSSSAYFDGWLDKNNYYKFILNVTAWNFVRTPIDKDEMTYVEFRKGFYEMRKALAKHYEEGAKVHGVDNWKKGLPIYGSERGGCFLDSMRRHTDQMLQRKTDEPHAVAALWNAFCALWTLKHKPYSATYQNASAVKAEEKPKSAHFDMVDSAINALKYMNEDKDRLSATKVITPSGKKFTIRKWPEGYEPVVDFEKEALMREMNLNYSSYNDIIDSTREVNLMNLEKRIENYHDTKYNLENVVEILRKIVNSKNFNRRADRVRQVYFDIYTALVILNDIIVWFHEYPDDMNHIKTIVSDVQCLINQNVGRIHECCGHITLLWASCPKCKYGYVVCLGEPNEDKMKILYETIERILSQLTNRNGTPDTFRGLGITQSLAKFNTDCIMRRIHNK